MMNKKDLEVLGFEVVENEMDYLPTLKEVYNDVFGKWATSAWEHNVEQRHISRFSINFLNEVFGNYDVLGYTVVITENRKVAFLNREHYFMTYDDHNDNDRGALAIVHLYEVKEYKDNGHDKFIMMTNVG